MRSFKKTIITINEIILGTCIVAIFVFMLAQVISRYFFSRAIIWSEELCRFLFVWFTMISFSYNVLTDNDVRLSIFYNKFPRTLKIIVHCAINIVTIGLFTYALPFVYKFVIQSRMTIMAALRIPRSFFYGASLVGYALLILALILDLVRVVQCIRKKEDF